MRFFTTFAALLGAVAAAPFGARPLRRDTSGSLDIKLINTLPTDVSYWVSGLDDNKNMVFLLQDKSMGQNTSPENIKHVLHAGEDTITIPGHLISGRIYFAYGGDLSFNVNADGTLAEPSAVSAADPASKINWGFIEITYNEDELYGNISYVDWVGLPVGLGLLESSGAVQTVAGLPSSAIDSMCDDLEKLESDTAPWGQLCVKDDQGKNLRILSPSDYIGNNPGAFNGYWGPYVDAVWNEYSGSNTLKVVTQSAGTIECSASGDIMTCGDLHLNKPNDVDIFGCNTGPFAVPSGASDGDKAVISTLCAAFHRGTYMTSATSQPAQMSTFYGQDTSTEIPNFWNQYAKILHQYEPDHKGYAFAYDDNQNPSDPDASGKVQASDPQLLTITVGGASQ